MIHRLRTATTTTTQLSVFIYESQSGRSHQKMLKKFPLNDPTRQNLGFVNPSTRQDISAVAVLSLANRFGCHVQADLLMDEYADYQLSQDSELPFISEDTSLDSFWFKIEILKTMSGGHRFGQRSEVALTVLSLPHSNAYPKRCFSTVRKIQTDHRDNLANRTLSLNSLLRFEFSENSECFRFNMSKELLRSSKEACSLYKLNRK
ncbi:uncharacterized protein LOC123529643 [Mercenaria mercenaria]|uniref:uncharacterized protein LOC123529643 n=1 Tax=Mercenaria mercenaria TaxID=6596 RepID=UPI00234E9127|nr:uncharacterized protein LOC123529643 [Mercenaria mercenaria]